MLTTIGLAVALRVNMNKISEFPKNSIVVDGAGLNDSLSDHQSRDFIVRNTSLLFWPKPSRSFHATYRKAAVATDSGFCSEIGRQDTLLAGGNAVDAMISSLLCIGVVHLQASGLGGGFVMTLYNASTQRCISINAREMAPRSANSTMFMDISSDSSIGWRSIATPGELHGFWTAFTRFGSGRVAWRDLFQPTIKLAREGFPVSGELALALIDRESDIMADEHMKNAFTDSRTGRIYKEGDIIKRQHLADTLEKLANATDPVQLFYKGEIAQKVADEFKKYGGYVTTEDLANYKTIIQDTPLESDALPGDFMMCGPPPPSGFAVTQTIIGVMSQFYSPERGPVDLYDPKVYHRLIEAEKFAYSYRTKLGDPNFVNDAENISRNMTKIEFIRWIVSRIPDVAQDLSYYNVDNTQVVEDHGTSSVSILDEEGNAVSTTSTINLWLGSRRISPTLGILWNDEMDDFSTPNQSNAYGFPPSKANFIQPGKRPLSSMSPMIIYNKSSGSVKMVVGGSGGSRIISAVAQTVIRSMLFNQTVKEAVDGPRFHNQFLPNVTEYEDSVPRAIINTLENQYNQSFSAVKDQWSVVQALVVMDDGLIHGNSDFRGGIPTYPTGY
ncbi:hypothetical protein FO519_005140 [Halicephalobus sp. NKZ332]|nr:hypothetical protein FO519_005140 [Halicephalobus sp. NKZ332]